MHINCSQSRIALLDEDELTLNEAMEQDSSAAKALLRKKWKEVNKELDGK
jgi:hypothetical protein